MMMISPKAINMIDLISTQSNLHGDIHRVHLVLDFIGKNNIMVNHFNNCLYLTLYDSLHIPPSVDRSKPNFASIRML